jgi:thiamine-phosphate pyrophosphorylase
VVRLLGITSGRADPDLPERIAAWGEAGIPGVCVREPHLDVERLEELVALARERIPFVAVHAKHPHAAEVAARLGVHLHLGAEDPRVDPVPFGVSCHDPASLDEAFARGARWAVLSPVWRPTSKPGDERAPLGLETYLAWAAGRPVLSLGGVDPARLEALLGAGGFGAAVLGGLDVPLADLPAVARAWAGAALPRDQNTNSSL